MTDLRAPGEESRIGLGPVCQAVVEAAYSKVFLLADNPESASGSYSTYTEWLQNKTTSPIFIQSVNLSSPTNFGEIYESAVEIIKKARKDNPDAELTFHLSPGTPAMAAVWIILSKTRFPAELIESSHAHGVKTVSVPFDISAEFIPDLLQQSDRRLERLSAGPPPATPEFDDIIHRCNAMKRVLDKAMRVAPRSVPVLIEGESGTGKELLARAIHRTGFRKDQAFVPVNCGAIPSELMESALFGHEKGAFTGAVQRRKGYFETADGGTLFLDEIGELPLPAQVKLLRVLQENEIVRVGAVKPISVSVRIIAATNRNLVEAIRGNQFRSDLFYRLAVAILYLPPLKDRKGDLSVLIDHLLEQVNQESRDEPGYKHKKISVNAKNLLIQHSWPGNVRELLNTLQRAAIWSHGDVIDVDDIRDSLISMDTSDKERILHQPLGHGLNLPEIIKTVACHYLERAMVESNGNKTKAAELVGLPSYQTLTNWMKRYGLQIER